MRSLLFSVIFSFTVAQVQAATALPSDLAGVWATESSEFRGEALLKGQAIYLDDDGVGGIVGGNGREVIGVRLVVTGYKPDTHTLSVNFTEGGKVIYSGILIYDQIKKILFSPQDEKQVFKRRTSVFSADARKSLGLEEKNK